MCHGVGIQYLLACFITSTYELRDLKQHTCPSAPFPCIRTSAHFCWILCLECQPVSLNVLGWAASPSEVQLGKNQVPNSFRLLAELLSLGLCDGGSTTVLASSWRGPQCPVPIHSQVGSPKALSGHRVSLQSLQVEALSLVCSGRVVFNIL